MKIINMRDQGHVFGGCCDAEGVQYESLILPPKGEIEMSEKEFAAHLTAAVQGMIDAGDIVVGNRPPAPEVKAVEAKPMPPAPETSELLANLKKSPKR